MLIRALLVLVLVFGSTQTSDAFDPSKSIEPFTNCPPDTNTIVSGYLGADNRLSAQITLSASTCSVQRRATGASVIQAAVIAANGKSASVDKAKCTETFNLVKQKIINYCAISDPRTCKEEIKLDPTSNNFTCGNKSSAETCESQLEPFIQQYCSSPALTPEQRKQLLKFASSAEGKLCAGGNKTAYGGERNKSFQMNGFVKDFCKKTNDANCAISQGKSGELNCEGGVSFELLQFKDACMPCTIIEKMVEVTAGLGKKVFDGIQSGTLSLLVTAVGIWIVIQVGKLLFPFGPLDRVSGIYNGVVTKLGLTLIVGTLLLSFGSYWKYIYAPVITSSINYTNTILKEANTIITGSPTASASDDPTCAPSADGITIDNTTEAEADARKIGKSITCLLKEIQATIYTGLSFSIEAMFQTIIGRNEDQPAPNNTPIFGNLITFGQNLFNAIYRAAITVATVSNVWGVLVTLIGGGILMLTWLPLYMNLPFRVADIVIRWTIISMLSPLMIAGAVFPATRGFMMAGLRGLVQSAFELMMIGVIMVLCTAAMQEVIELSKGDKTPFTVSSALFLQLWTIAWLANIMMGKVQSFAVAFADPSDAQGQGLDTGVASEYAKRMEDSASKAAQQGAKTASDVTATVGQKEIK